MPGERCAAGVCRWDSRYKPLVLPLGEQVDAGVQGLAGTVERIIFAATVAVDDLLDPAAAPGEGVAGELCTKVSTR